MRLRNFSRLYWLIALIIVLLAAVLRFHLLDAQSLWNDEGSAYVQSTRTFFEIADNAARDIHPPGYYLLLAIWRLLSGETEFALRSLSAFAGVLTVALTYALSRRLYHPTAGLAAALFVALNTFQLYYSQEMRMYALLGLWSVGAMWAFVGFIQTRQRRWALAFALLNVMGLYTHYAYPAVMLTQGVLFVLWWANTILIQRTQYTTPLQSTTVTPVPSPVAVHRFPLFTYPSSLLTYLLANLLTIALYLPWLPTALRQITTWPSTGEPIPTGEALQVVFGWFALGITYSVGSTSSAIVFFLLFGLIVLQQRARSGASWWAMLVPVLWVAVTVGGFLVLGLFREANLKFLIAAQIGFAIWLGRGVWVLWTLRPRRTAPIFQTAPKLAAAVGVLSLAAALWSGLDPLYHAPQFQRDDYRSIAAAINPNDAVILNAPGQIEVFRYYFSGQHVYPLPIGLTVDNAATLAAVRDIIRQHNRIHAVLWGTSERDPQNLVEHTLDTEAYEIDNHWYGDVRLVRYGASDAMGATINSGARFDEAITLQRFAVGAQYAAPLQNDALIVVQPGDVLQLRLEWTTDSPLPMDYAIFVQLLSPEGLPVTQRDSAPGGGTKPTSGWIPGETVVDHHALMIPHNLTPANYSLIIGFYNPANPSERLTVTNLNLSNSADDYLKLGDVTVEAGGG